MSIPHNAVDASVGLSTLPHQVALGIKSRSRPPQRERNPPEQAVDGDDSDQDPNPLPGPSLRIPILMKHTTAPDLALRRQIRLIHAVAPGTAVIDPPGELVDHHALKYVGLVVDVVEDVLPERVQDGRGHEEAADGHPEAVGEGDEGQGDDEVGEDGGDEDDEGFGGHEVEEEPHHPGEEGGAVGAEVGEPVGDDGEEDGDDDCVVVISVYVYGRWINK